MKSIIIIQHPQSEQHINRMVGSWANWDLTEKGVKQAHSIGKRLVGEIGEERYSVYSSDLLRARHTSEIVSSYLNVTPTYNSLLREFYLGEAVGQTKEWARSNIACPVWSDTLDWANSTDGLVFNGAETRRDVWPRVSEFYDTVIAPSGDNYIIVSHSGIISILMALWLGMDIESLNKCTFWGKSGGVSFLNEDNDGNHIISKFSDMSYVK